MLYDAFKRFKDDQIWLLFKCFDAFGKNLPYMYILLVCRTKWKQNQAIIYIILSAILHSILWSFISHSENVFFSVFGFFNTTFEIFYCPALNKKFKNFAHIWNVQFVIILIVHQEIYFPLLQLCTSVFKISQ